MDNYPSPRILLIGHNSDGAGKILEIVSERLPNCEILVACTQGLYYRSTFHESVWRLIREASWLFLVFRAIEYLRPSHLKLLKVCRRRGIRFFRTRDINSAQSLKLVRRLAPDIIASTFTMHIAGSNLIQSSKVASIGVHPSILPSYRGLEVFFWMMANGEVEGGTSTYELTPEVDAGRIFMQERWAIEQPDSVEYVYKRLSESCGRLLADTIEVLLSGIVPASPPALNREESYFAMPTRQAMRLFRSNRHRWWG